MAPNIYWIRRRQVIFFKSSKPLDYNKKILIKITIFNVGKFLKTLVKEQQQIKILRMDIKKLQSPFQKTM